MTARVALVGAAQSRTALFDEVRRLVDVELVPTADLRICLGHDPSALTDTQTPTLALLGGGDIGAAVTLLLDGASHAVVDEAAPIVAEALGAALALFTPGADRLTVESALRDDALRTIDHALEEAGVRKRIRQRVQLVLDELLMNALYDAPVDGAGRPQFADVVPGARSTIVAPACELRWGFRGTRFFVSVRDRFGSLSKATALRYLAKCLQRPKPPLDDKPGGAGLGLYLIAHNADALYFHLRPGEQTEVTCAFESAAHRPGLGLQAIGVRETLPSRERG